MVQLLPSLVILTASHLHSLSSQEAMKNCYNIKDYIISYLHFPECVCEAPLSISVVQPSSCSAELLHV